MVKYLIKFVSKREYALDLVKGKLFMRPASYYHCLEQGQGDIREAALSNEIAMYKNMTVPIYCMYAVTENDIVDGIVRISNRCIRDFHCESGFAVVIDFSLFEPMLSQVDTNGYTLVAGLVNYYQLQFEDMGKLFADRTLLNLFVKHPYFAYQQEFRIAIAKQVYKYNEPVINSVEYCFKNGLGDCAKIIDISKLQRDKENYMLYIEQVTTNA